jgi:hypothetical protein
MLLVCHTNKIISKFLSDKAHSSHVKGQGHSKYTLYVKQTFSDHMHVIHKVVHWLDAIQGASISLDKLSKLSYLLFSSIFGGIEFMIV